MKAAVIIPWAGNDPDREDAKSWVLSKWDRAAREADVEVIVAEAPADGPWCKADAVMPAVEATEPGTIVLVSDADVWCHAALTAVSAVAEGAAWAIPHLYVRRLTRDASRAVYEGASFEDLTALDFVENAYRGVEGGGLFATTRERLLDAPFDSRFTGWGCEDTSLGYAYVALHGWPWRGEALLYHLWHPPSPRADRKTAFAPNEALRKRYHAQLGSPQGMRAILDEALEAASWRSSPST